MSDARLRELERAWQASGRPQDEAAYLVEAVRAGRLTQDELELAAWARHQAACHALGGPLPGPTPEELSRWVVGLGRWGRPLCVKVALRAIDHVIARLGTPDELPDHEARIGALRRWCATPEGPPDALVAELGRLAARSLRAGTRWREQLLVAAVLTAKAALEADFAAHAANAVVRCEAALGEGECRDAVVGLVVAHALRRPAPPLPPPDAQ